MLPSQLSALLELYAPSLAGEHLEKLQTYLDLLLRWNAKMNLTAIREPEQIVMRHFGESLFLARLLPQSARTVVDVGSGAGFPGIPIAIARPELTITLIEAQQKKAIFLREAVRAVRAQVEVENKRIEEFAAAKSGFADVVTMRAVEAFASVVPTAARLVRGSAMGKEPGRLALLVGIGQEAELRDVLPNWSFAAPIKVPNAENRVILFAEPR
ncbi:MAG TPA: 16S rRNA (guanine(527)-N(7))-methyltransferase RsmG [Terriglobales bacterium]|nr:16S rRNA (guanine(527)-N(7))-methyltransferase RsmG [Terriglobales bacterium]